MMEHRRVQMFARKGAGTLPTIHCHTQQDKNTTPSWQLDANLTWAASMMKLGRVEATHSFVGGPLLAVNNRERGLHPDAKEEMRHANSGECLLSSASIMQLLVWKNGL
eukprot:scaffold211390_cov19-Tisochrysis_lutea.AAC.1